MLVIHSWDSVGEEKTLFSTCMEEAFQKEGINANVHHIYANMLHRSPALLDMIDWPQYLDSIKKWKPEVILLNDDPILSWVLRNHSRDSLFRNTPVVFAGVNVLIRDSLQNFPLMTGFGCNVNITRTLEMLMAVTGSQIANVELDHSEYDEALRRKFYSQITDSTRFINNNISYIEDVDNQYMREHYPAKMLVNFVSCANPESNRREGEPLETGKKNLTKTYLASRRTWQVQVKYDIFSNSIIDKTRMPQFTCIRQQFNDPQHLKILGGYFTSTETQVKDQVSYAAQILRGTSPQLLPIGIHESGYYMDYNAMQQFSPALKYETFVEKYKIVNVPIALREPVKYSLIIALIALLASGFIAILGQILYHWRKRSQNAILDNLMYEEKMHDLIFSDGNDTLWYNNGEVMSVGKEYAQKHGLASTKIPLKTFYSMVHPYSLSALKEFNDFPNQRGKKIIRLQLTFDGGNTWSWYELTYTATEESAKTGYLYGIMLNINRKKEIEDALFQAQIKASEVALKENFLANISHDLRTPLNAITGFSMLLASRDMTFEPGEREEYGKIIHENTDMILKMIDSVVEKAQIETGDIRLALKPVSTQYLVKEAYMTNKIIAPARLSFLEEQPELDETIEINIDFARTMQVINNFLSNAFKFTKEGSVTLGWQYLPEGNIVEVYVKDTGIGISEENQKKLFDRYYKENETDRGTGLGLNISQTIMKKQGGSIGVESTQGKGSKFFFHIPRYVHSLLLALALGISGGLLSSCDKYKDVTAEKKNILVIHGYGGDFPSYKWFDEKLASTLRKQHVNANIKNVYLALENPAASGEAVLAKMADSLNRTGWKIDLILSEGDRTAYDISTYKLDRFFSYIDSIPIVFGSLHHPNRDFLREHKNTVVFYDPIDYPANINLAVELTGVNIVGIELDYFAQDTIIREELLRSTARPPYVTGNKFFPTIQNLNDISTVYRDSILVYTISVESPERNDPNNSDGKYAKNVMKNIYMNAWTFPQLSVKRDMYSKEIINKTARPQFSAVKAGFADGTGTYLAGYFAGYRTVAADIATAGAKLLRGEDAKDLSGKQHEKRYYMDYKAMQTLGLKYDDYADRFTIVGAPLKYSNPEVFYSTRVILILFALIVAVVWLALINFLRERTGQLLLEDVRKKANLRVLALNGADSRQIRNEEEMKNVFSHIHADHKENVPLIEQAMQIAGQHEYDIFADVDEDGKYEWWQLRFVVLLERGNRKRIDGLVININESKKYEEELRTAMRLAEEAKEKENFLMTISHEIRTPLNAVVGFSDVIISLPPEALTQEDLDEFSKSISDNNEKLAVMIENILMFSRIESGRLQYVKSEFNVAEIIDEVAGEWKNKIPENIKFVVSNFRDHIYVNSDRTRIKYILNQLLSNAIKFTTEGIISLTSFYHYKTGEVELIVEDSGCGISTEKQQAVFNLFWKNDEFIPGLGLGLNVARKLADGMGARLQVDSQKDFGSAFSLFLKAELKKEPA